MECERPESICRVNVTLLTWSRLMDSGATISGALTSSTFGTSSNRARGSLAASGAITVPAAKYFNSSRRFIDSSLPECCVFAQLPQCAPDLGGPLAVAGIPEQYPGHDQKQCNETHVSISFT